MSQEASSRSTFPCCCFQSQVRRRPEFVQRGERKLLGVFDCAPSDDWVGSFDAPTEAAFRDELRKNNELLREQRRHGRDA